MEDRSLENMNENFSALKSSILIQLNLFCAWFSFVFCVIPGEFGKESGHGFAQHFGDCQVPMNALTVHLAHI